MQTDTHVMILIEMVHDARVVRIELEARAAGDQEMAGRLDRLVGGRHAGGRHHQLPAAAGLRGGRENLHVVERFTAQTDGNVLYSFTVEDPADVDGALERRVHLARPADERVFEYACHEGNYAMGNILRGARLLEEDAKKTGSKSSGE